ncbi:MAG: DUF2878 domain-containing protein [Thermoanaerobaculia bacterium]
MNFALYEAGWFACVLGAARGFAFAGAAAALVLILLHFVLARSRRVELEIALFAGLCGLILDSIQGLTGRLHFAGTLPAPASLPFLSALAPLWVVVLWAQLGTSLRFSLRWLSERYLLAALFGMVGGPLAFLGGERLGAATWGSPRWATALTIAAVWGSATPLLVLFADRRGRGLASGYRFDELFRRNLAR